jgi:hypothetical protein
MKKSLEEIYKIQKAGCTCQMIRVIEFFGEIPNGWVHNKNCKLIK